MVEHRRGRRHDTDVAVRFVALPATIGAGRITNISLTGAFMETACKLPLRTVVHIEGLDSRKQRGANGTAKRLAAKVVRRCTAGVGLEWCVPYKGADADTGADLDAGERALVDAQAQIDAQTELGTDTRAVPTGDAERCVYHLQFID